MVVLILSSQAFSLYQFRFDMIKDFIIAGHTVYTAAPEQDIDCSKLMSSIGASYMSFYLQRNGINPIKDIRTIFSILKLIKNIHPDLIFTYQAKTVIYGSIAAKILGIKHRYALIAGLGSIFRNDVISIRQKIIRVLFSIQYKIALASVNIIFFQNIDDSKLLIKKHIINKKSKICYINGSGVNLEKYKQYPMVKENRFLFVGRLIRDKGIIEYLEAARIVKTKYKNATFEVVGYYDTNPTAVSPAEIEPYFNSGIAIFHGKQTNVINYLKNAYAFVLPSYHEGTPKSVLEAMAVGRPIITTNVPGCKETVVNGWNGILVPDKNVHQLVDAIIWLIEHPDIAVKMGQASRTMAVEKFDVKKINSVLMDMMNL